MLFIIADHLLEQSTLVDIYTDTIKEAFGKNLDHSRCSFGPLQAQNPVPKTGSNMVKWLGQ